MWGQRKKRRARGGYPGMVGHRGRRGVGEVRRRRGIITKGRGKIGKEETSGSKGERGQCERS